MNHVIKILGYIALAIILVAISNLILSFFHQQWHFWSFKAGMVVLGVFIILLRMFERDKTSSNSEITKSLCFKCRNSGTCDTQETVQNVITVCKNYMQS
jgi:hypothetical protein